MHNYLIHHGVKGQKWGIRRYQNPDGTLTDEGKRRYIQNTLENQKLAKIFVNYNDKRNLDLSYEKAKRKIFLNNEIKPQLQDAYEVRTQIKNLYNNTISESSDYALKGYKNYLKRNNLEDTDDAAYGFYHFKWGKGNPEYDEANKIYSQQGKDLKKEYQEMLTIIGKNVIGDNYDMVIDKKDNTTYLSQGKMYIDQLVWFGDEYFKEKK